MIRRLTIRRLVPAAVCLSAAALALGYALAGAWPWVVASLALGALWLAGQWLRWPQTSPLGFATSVILAGVCALSSTSPSASLLALIAVVAALCTWDLDGLARRLERYPFVGDQARLERQHLVRLLAVAALGFFLAAAALALQIRFSLLPTLLLSLLVVLGLSWVFFFLRTQDT